MGDSKTGSHHSAGVTPRDRDAALRAAPQDEAVGDSILRNFALAAFRQLDPGVATGFAWVDPNARPWFLKWNSKFDLSVGVIAGSTALSGTVSAASRASQ